MQDDAHDLYCEGYVDSIDTEQTAQNMNWQFLTGQIIIVCPRPELLSTIERGCQLQCASLENGSGGLSYHPQDDFLATEWLGEPNNSVSILFVTLEGDEGIHYPLTYYLDDDDAAASNTGVVTNNGSSPARPVFRVHGPMPDGVDLEFPGTDLRLQCSLPVYEGSELILIHAPAPPASTVWTCPKHSSHERVPDSAASWRFEPAVAHGRWRVGRCGIPRHIHLGGQYGGYVGARCEHGTRRQWVAGVRRVDAP